MRKRGFQESRRSRGIPPRRPPVVPLRKGDGFIPLLEKEGLGEAGSSAIGMSEIREDDAFKILDGVVESLRGDPL